MKTIGWKAWYTQNRVYRSSIDSWEDLPKVGLLCVVVFLHKDGEDHDYKEILNGNRRYFMAIGSSGNTFLKPSLWKEAKLLETYDTKPEWIKEGIWDDEETIERVNKEALASTSDER